MDKNLFELSLLKIVNQAKKHFSPDKIKTRLKLDYVNKRNTKIY